MTVQVQLKHAGRITTRGTDVEAGRTDTIYHGHPYPSVGENLFQVFASIVSLRRSIE
jgi:hypothetical protein